MAVTSFDWDRAKDRINRLKHGIPFALAQRAFLDPRRIILEDLGHGGRERRFYCIGMVDRGIITVRFTYRARRIRIFGAGFWRRGKKLYEKEHPVHR